MSVTDQSGIFTTLAQIRLSSILYLSREQELPLTIDRIIETSTEGRKTSSRSILYERSSGMSQANLEFDQLKQQISE